MSHTTLTIFAWTLLLSGLLDASTACAQSASTSPGSDAALLTSSNHLLLVVGAPGEDEYAGEFQSWADAWLQLAGRQAWTTKVIGDHPAAPKLEADASAHAALKQAVAAQVGRPERLWIILLGHGTFARNVAKFNLPGPDVSAQELNQWLVPVTSTCIIVNCASASAPFLTTLASKNRILLTATRSGTELNYARFGKFLSLSVNDLTADIDHDKEVSLLEAFLAASSQTERFYREDARLATEHALLDDNGDSVGTSGDFYRGIRPAKQAAPGQSLDGATAGRIILYSSPELPDFSPSQLAERERIELAIEALRDRKSQLPADSYLQQLEQLLLELAQVYEEAEAGV